MQNCWTRRADTSDSLSRLHRCCSEQQIAPQGLRVALQHGLEIRGQDVPAPFRDLEVELLRRPPRITHEEPMYLSVRARQHLIQQSPIPAQVQIVQDWKRVPG